MRHLGIDYGSSKVGLALSDEMGMMGFPNSVVTNSPRLIEDLCALISREQVRAVVIGDSRTLAGGHNPIAKSAVMLGKQITERTNVPVYFENEVFTSAEAHRAPEKEVKTRAPKARANVDASAAALILTSYLTRQNRR